MWGTILSFFSSKVNLFKYIGIGVGVLSLIGLITVSYLYINNMKEEIILLKSQKLQLNTKLILKETHLQQAKLIAESNAKEALKIKSNYINLIDVLNNHHKRELKKVKSITIIKTSINNIKPSEDGNVSKVVTNTLDALRELQNKGQK